MTQTPSGLRCSYGRGIDDSNGLDDFLLVRLGTGTVDVADDGRHAGLVAHGGSEVDGLLGVILGEARKEEKGGGSVSNVILSSKPSLISLPARLALPSVCHAVLSPLSFIFDVTFTNSKPSASCLHLRSGRKRREAGELFGGL